MAILVILISSNSSEDSMETPAGRVILFGTIPTTILDTTPVIAPPTTQTDTTRIPTETPIIAPTIPPSPDYTLASPDYLPASEAEFVPSSGHIPPLPARLSVIPCRRVMILAPGQPILLGRPYRYHPNGPVHMMTARKRVRPLPVQQLSVRHSVDHSSSDSSSRYSSSDHSSPDLPSTSAGPSRKRRRSPMTFVPALPLVSEALSPVLTDLIPSPKRVRDIGYLADVEVGPREIRIERVTHPAMLEDIPGPAQEGSAEVTYETLGDLVKRKMPNTRSGASMTHEEVEELVARRVAEEMEAREAARNLETLNENEEEQEGENGENENGGNGGNENEGNGENENHGMNYGSFMPMARECTFQDFLKCKPHTFSGTKGVVGLTRWFEKIERTIGVDAAYAMKWAGLMKLMTEVYCLRNEVQKMETELWNLAVKGNDLTAYTQRFQELILLCTRMVPDEEDRVERQNTTGQNVATTYTAGNNERKGYLSNNKFHFILYKMKTQTPSMFTGTTPAAADHLPPPENFFGEPQKCSPPLRSTRSTTPLATTRRHLHSTPPHLRRHNRCHRHPSTSPPRHHGCNSQNHLHPAAATADSIPNINDHNHLIYRSSTLVPPSSTSPRPRRHNRVRLVLL
nr:hypothetical protein [Tanacetum cinerariifolium]